MRRTKHKIHIQQSPPEGNRGYVFAGVVLPNRLDITGFWAKSTRQARVRLKKWIKGTDPFDRIELEGLVSQNTIYRIWPDLADKLSKVNANPAVAMGIALSMSGNLIISKHTPPSQGM